MEALEAVSHICFSNIWFPRIKRSFCKYSMSPAKGTFLTRVNDASCYYGNIGKLADFSIRPISKGLLKVCLNKVLLFGLPTERDGQWEVELGSAETGQA